MFFSLEQSKSEDPYPTVQAGVRVVQRELHDDGDQREPPRSQVKLVAPNSQLIVRRSPLSCYGTYQNRGAKGAFPHVDSEVKLEMQDKLPSDHREGQNGDMLGT